MKHNSNPIKGLKPSNNTLYNCDTDYGVYIDDLEPLRITLINHFGSIVSAKNSNPHLWPEYKVSLKPKQTIPHHLRDVEFRFEGSAIFEFELIRHFEFAGIKRDYYLRDISIELTIKDGSIISSTYEESDKELSTAIQLELNRFKHISDYFVTLI